MIAARDLLDEALGDFHRPDQIDLQDPAPTGVIGLPEWWMRAADAGIVEEDIHGLSLQVVRKRFDRRMIADIEPDQFDIAGNPCCVLCTQRIKAGGEDPMPVRGVLPGEFEAEAGVAPRDQDCSHGNLTNDPLWSVTKQWPRRASA